MNIFYIKSSATIKRGYSEMMYLLTSQAIFYNMFGENTHMFAAQPKKSIIKNNKEDTMKFLDLCKL